MNPKAQQIQLQVFRHILDARHRLGLHQGEVAPFKLFPVPGFDDRFLIKYDGVEYPLQGVHDVAAFLKDTF